MTDFQIFSLSCTINQNHTCDEITEVSPFYLGRPRKWAGMSDNLGQENPRCLKVEPWDGQPGRWKRTNRSEISSWNAQLIIRVMIFPVDYSISSVALAISYWRATVKTVLPPPLPLPFLFLQPHSRSPSSWGAQCQAYPRGMPTPIFPCGCAGVPRMVVKAVHCTALGSPIHIVVCSWDAEMVRHAIEKAWFKPSFLNLSMLNILGQIIRCCHGPSFYTVGCSAASRPLPTRQWHTPAHTMVPTNDVSRHCQKPHAVGKIAPCWELLTKERCSPSISYSAENPGLAHPRGRQKVPTLPPEWLLSLIKPSETILRAKPLWIFLAPRCTLTR